METKYERTTRLPAEVDKLSLVAMPGGVFFTMSILGVMYISACVVGKADVV